MADISGTFSATGQSASFALSAASLQKFANAFAVYLKPAAFIGAVALERSINNGVDWYPINAAGIQLYKWSFAGTEGNLSETGQAIESREIYRLNCTARSAGSIDYVISSAE